MLRVMLLDLWRRNAWLYVVLAALATIAPLRLAMAVGMIDGDLAQGGLVLLQTSSEYGRVHAAVAVLAGLLMGSGVWQSDITAGHVYALTLPTPRWHYALLRFATGVLILCAVVAAFWIGSLVAATLVSLPSGLQAYPTALSVRFALTALLSFSLFYALSSLTTRTAAVVLLAIAGVIILEIALRSADASWSVFDMVKRDEDDWLLASGRWMLFDV